MKLNYQGKEHDAYLSHVKVPVTASRKDIYLVLVCGITDHPMMLATNKEIHSKEDVIRKRGHQALVSDEASEIPSNLPKADCLNR